MACKAIGLALCERSNLSRGPGRVEYVVHNDVIATGHRHDLAVAIGFPGTLALRGSQRSDAHVYTAACHHGAFWKLRLRLEAVTATSSTAMQ